MSINNLYSLKNKVALVTERLDIWVNQWQRV
jgi:hypothetical protein